MGSGMGSDGSGNEGGGVRRRVGQCRGRGVYDRIPAEFFLKKFPHTTEARKKEKNITVEQRKHSCFLSKIQKKKKTSIKQQKYKIQQMYFTNTS
jgi:hypothetical protein